MNFVYLTTNLINGKKYVGSHHTNNINDNYLGSGKILKLSIKKYGVDNFKRTILKQCESIKEARLLEEVYIKEYNTLIPNGYNISSIGGSGMTGKRWGYHTKETKQKIGISLKKHWVILNSIDFKIKLEERNNKISNKLKGRIKSCEHIEKWKANINKNNTFVGENNPMFGKSQTEQTKQLISLKNKGNIKCGGRKDKVFASFIFYNNGELICEIIGQKNAKIFCKEYSISFQALCKKSDNWKTWYCKRNKLNKNDNK